MKTVEQVAKEVIAGKWGSGETRKKKLKAAGYNYNEVQKKVNELLTQQKPYENLKASNYVSSIVYIGQATADERGKASGGAAGDQKGGEVGISKWSYSSTPSYNHWTMVCRIKDKSKRLVIAQAMIDTCNNNHIGYDIQKPDRYTAYDEAQKVKWDINKITKNCETTCSQAVSMCLRAAGVSSTYAPRHATVDVIRSRIKESGLFYLYTDSNHVAKSTSLKVGDILISATHVAVVVKAPAINQTYSGTYPSLTLKKSNKKVISDAILWGNWIAGDNSFHYGKGKHAHHNGCYFCGTQPKVKKEAGIKDYKKTYCCNPFIGAAWAHGGGITKALEMCKKGKSWDFNKGSGYDASSLFKNLGKPARSKLKKGDVLCSNTHVMMYIGNGKIMEAAYEDDNVRNSKKWNSSIRITTLTAARYAGVKRVHRYTGSVNTKRAIEFGEVSTRVKQLQSYLNWYFGKKVCGTPDGLFGSNTLKYVKKFQEKRGLKADGVVGPATIEEMKKVKK